MFCTKCGKEIPNDSTFCPSCGNPIKQKKEKSIEPMEYVSIPKRKLANKKWIIPAGIILGASIILLGVFAINGGLNSNKRALKAYKDYYSKFYKENTGKLEIKEAQSYDCAGRIIMGPDGKYMMTIMDVTSASDDEVKENLYLYTYERGKVKKKTELHNIQPENLTTYMITIDKKVYLMYVDNEESKDFAPIPLYVLNKDNEFEKVKWQLKDGVKKCENNQATDYETEQGISHTRLVNLFAGFNEDYMIANSLMLVNGKDFEYVLDELTEEKIKNQLELQLFYGKAIQKLNIEDYTSEYPIVAVGETKYGYYGIRTSGNACLNGVKKSSITDITPTLKEAEGHKVTGIGYGAFAGCEKLENIEIPDNITYINEYAFAGCSALKSVIIPDSIKELGGLVFDGCKILEKVQISDSVEKIGGNLFGDYTDKICPVIVFCNKETVIQKYVTENNIYYINGTIDTAEKDEIEKVRQKVMALNQYAERYQQEKENDSSTSVSLIYLNNDAIPECILYDGSMEACLLSYQDGKLLEFNSGEAGSHISFSYSPKSGKIMLEEILGLRSATWWEIVELSDGFKKIGSAWTDNDRNNVYFKVNDNDVEDGEFSNYLNSFSFSTEITGYDEEGWYSSITEAYYALEK